MTVIQFLEKIVKPMLAASEVKEEASPPKKRNETLVTLPSGKILIRNAPKATSAWRIARGQAFSEQERKLVSCLVKEFFTVSSYGDEIVPQVLDFVTRRAIANSLIENETQRHTFEHVLEVFESWSTQTYEGARISAGVEVTAIVGPVPDSPRFSSIANEDFVRALTDGIDSWWRLYPDGTIDSLQVADSLPNTNANLDGYFPVRYRTLATVTTGDNVSIALNRNGEILIFAGSHIRFARRRGMWLHFAHEAIIKQMSSGRKKDRPIREAIYKSCLDTSFARTGACVGLVRKDKLSNMEEQKVLEFDDCLDEDFKKRLQAPQLVSGREQRLHKSRTAATIIRGKTFSDLDRGSRKELLSLDGACLVLYNGQILAAGAIVNLGNIEHGNQGGRSVAAKTLGQFGSGIKVSQDGKISGYNQHHLSDPWFQVG